uniref:MH1 domain-containing protein n=1 Tax=Meloidogyne hapla TaxID=6305 RepID=A0A1I8BSU5_MELHA
MAHMYSPNGLSPPAAPPRPPLPNSFPSGNAALPPKPKSPQPAPRRSFSQISPPSIYYSQNGNNSDENTWIANQNNKDNNFGENSQPPRPNRNNVGIKIWGVWAQGNGRELDLKNN